MSHSRSGQSSQSADGEWVAFPGGELEGLPPRVLCSACRAGAVPAGGRCWSASDRGPRLLCFQCYRASLERERALRAAAELDTSSPERLQAGLPFEPVNRPRLEMLRAERASSRRAMEAGAGHFVARQRRAQIAARHALRQIAAGRRVHESPFADLGIAVNSERVERARALAAAIHAAELQLPESWLPFVVSQ